jgi:hypothetical protein
MTARRDKDIERLLRANRPQPRDDFVRDVARRTVAAPRRPHLRFALAGALSAAMLIALGAVGGLGYAASSVTHAAKLATRLVTPAKTSRTAGPVSISAGGDQYQPGYGFGDPNHNHAGAPRLQRGNGEFAPPVRPKTKDGTVYVSTTITIDEQAHLTISVVDAKTGKKLLITQEKSSVGQGVKGPPTKNIEYLVLVPRAIRIRLAIPRALLVHGRRYLIEVVAIDPDGNRSKISVPFVY